MNVLVFIILSIVYCYFFFKVYNKTKEFDGLKVSLILSALQLVSYIGNFNSDYFLTPFGTNFIQFSGNLASSIGQNFFIIIAVIIVVSTYRKKQS